MMEGSASSARTDGRTQAEPYDPTMPTINNIDGFVRTIACNPSWQEAVQANELRQERPDPCAELVQLTQKKKRPVNELLERL